MSTMSYLPPTPPLHVVQATLTFSNDPTVPPGITGRVVGSSEYKRLPLWTESSVWDTGDDLLMAPADWIHHVVLVALQDRPNTSERLLFGLTGGLGQQLNMF